MAYEIPVLPHSVYAGVDLRTSQYLALALDTTTGKAILPAAGAAIVGVLQNAPNINEEVALESKGITKLVVGAGCTPGIQVEVLATGKITPKTTGIAIGYVVQGATTDGQIASVILY